MYKSLLIWLRTTFGFSRTEANGYLVLIALMIGVHFCETHYSNSHGLKLEDGSFQDSLRQLFVAFTKDGTVLTDSFPAFDPNRVESDSLLKWGIDSYITTNIVKYREAGGRFSQPSDLKKIFGMTDSIWLAINTSIQIPTNEMEQKSNVTADPIFEPVANGNSQRININNADSVWLQSIYGIGPVLSKRIVKYRNLLGGFYSEEQLHEVYGLSDETVANLRAKLFTISKPELAKIDLNKADLKQLVTHPYFSYHQAQAIIAYRDQHGKFEAIEDIKKIHLIGDSTYLRVYPYLDF